MVLNPVFLLTASPNRFRHCEKCCDNESPCVDAAINAQSQELLREYRTRLIADVVTGKLDVRETAASLPEGAGQ